MLKTILFDMGNVLVKFSHDRMCAQIGAVCGRTGAETRKILLGSELQWRSETGHVTEDEFHTQLQDWCGRPISRDDLLAAASDIFWQDEHPTPILRALKARGLRLVLLSNTNENHFRRVWEHFDCLQEFDDVVLSCRVGAMKPQDAIYEAALARINCAPHECFYTDDIVDYVAAGRLHGLQADVFTDCRNLRTHLAERGIVLEG